MAKIRRLFWTVIILVLAVGGLTLFSLENEREHLSNCESLGVHCEAGQVHRTTDEFYEWLKKQYSSLFQHGEPLPQPADHSGLLQE